jgi:hypothetical protein
MSTSVALPAIENPKPAVTEYPYLLITTRKLVIMSILTLNLYNFYWFSQNWKAVNAAENVHYRTFVRSLFALFFMRGLLERMGAENPTLGPVIYLAASFATKLPDPWGLLLGVLNFIPLVWAQQKVNAAHDESAVSNRYSAKEIVFAVIGSLVWILALLGMTAQ